MICPYCGFEDQEVLNTRITYKGFANWRRRKCLECGGVFTTHEFINLTYIKVIKKSGIVRIYSRARLFSGIFVAFRNIKHMDSGDAAMSAEIVTSEIEKVLIGKKINKISTHELALITAGILAKKNYTAFINYGSYFFAPEVFKRLLVNRGRHN
ncbi:hypothetical protein GYA27_00680 [candidate division WWE3 bacterium]|uniref:ATP-cone domain-containing protein n=1 Tax=candidate division WWE3 bacterium TaxID=2053526 RepID=A0A7X9DJN4_UNCKA|nr:hypothetical protein [candidate division WWE3 bacterium]